MRRRLGLVAAYAAVTLVMAQPLINYAAISTAAYPGDARLIIWTLAWDNHALLTGAPLFQSNIFFPARDSLQYNEHLFGLSLFTLPIYAITHNPVLAYNLVWLASFLLNALAMHALLRRYTKDDLASAAGALVFAFSYYRMLQAHGHLQQVWTFLLPVSLLLLHRWDERPGWGRATAWVLAVVLQSLTSWYLAILTLLANGMLLLWRLALARRDLLRRVTHVTVAAVAGATLMWPFARHYRELATASLVEVAGNSADAAAYLLPPEHTWVGHAWTATLGAGPRWLWGEQTLFLGFVAMALAFGGLLAFRDARRRTVAVPYACMAVCALALSFGPGEGTWWRPFNLLSAVPGFPGFRAPARFALVVLLGLSVFAAFGALAIRERWGRRGAVLLVLLFPLMLSEWFVIGFVRPEPFAVPTIYRAPEIAQAHAILSLPIYRGTPGWFFEPDYLYFSTLHWRPIVNGYGRSEPAGYAGTVKLARDFPSPASAAGLRELGVDTVILHTSRYPDGAGDLVRQARASAGYELAAQRGSDYLFRVK